MPKEEERMDLSAFNLLASEVNIPNGGQIGNGKPNMFDNPVPGAEDNGGKGGVIDARTKDDKGADPFKIQNRDSLLEDEDEEEEEDEDEDPDGDPGDDDKAKADAAKLEADKKKAAKKPKAGEESEDEEEQEEEEEEEEESDSPFRNFASFLHEKGIADYDPETFEDSEKGLMEMMDKTVKGAINKYKESVPASAKEFLEYLEAGGDPKNYVEKSKAMPNYKGVSEEALSKESVQKTLIVDWMRADGSDDEEIRETIEDYEASGMLEKQARRIHPKLVKKQEAHDASILEEQKKAHSSQMEAHKKYVDDIKKSIDEATEIAGLAVPVRKKGEFFKYVTEPNKEGKTKLLADIEADPQAQLKMAWLMYNKFDFSNIEKKVKTQVSSKLRDSLANLDSSTKLKGVAKRKREAQDTDELDLSSWKRIL